MKGLHGGYVGQSAIIDFSANINPLGLAPGAKKALMKSIGGVINYPEPDSHSLKKALADTHGINEDNLAVGNGSIELIYAIPRALGSGVVLIVTPTFSEYEFASRSAGAKVIFFNTAERDGFRIQLKDLERHVPRSGLVFLANPNNPTGTCLSSAEISEFSDVCMARGAVLVIDEAFMDFTESWRNGSMVRTASKRPGILVIRSLTKFFAMPGLRLGYCVGHKALIKVISDIQYPWNVNSLAQAAGRIVLEDKEYMRKARVDGAKERLRFYNILKRIKGLKALNPASNFILCKLDRAAIKSASALNRALFRRGMIVRDCGNFRGLNGKYFRVAVKSRSENTKLIAALKKVL